MASKSHFNRLKRAILSKRGKAAWNKWRDENYDDFQIDITEVDLHGADLCDMNLVNVNFGGSDLSGANLSESAIMGSDLSGTNLTNAKLVRSDFLAATLFDAILDGASLQLAHLFETDLSFVSLKNVFLADADLTGANLTGADLSGANLTEADLSRADLTGADLTNARLYRATLTGANLTEANLSGADLSESNLCEANLSKANLTGCNIYAISAWNVQLEEAIQSSLIITRYDEPTITVDNLKIAQFIYLLLNNKEIRDVIDTISKKVVLILGRFTSPRKVILDAIKDELRKHDYLPVLFDFDKPDSRDTLETISALAHLSHFVIADITNPKSIPEELVVIVRSLPSVPIQPLLKYGSKPWGMYDHIKRASSVLELHRYKSLDDLLPSLEKKVIEPAEKKARELKP